jgi:hypothetical protein
MMEVHKLCSLRAKPLTSLSMQPIPVDKTYPHSCWKKEMRGLLQMLKSHIVCGAIRGLLFASKLCLKLVLDTPHLINFH